MRNIGHTQIFSNRGKLHFHQAPTLAKSAIADSLLILHYGLLSAEDRKAKYKFYLAEDTDGCHSSYEHFGEKAHPSLNNVDEITIQKLRQLSQKLISRSL